MLTYSEHWKEQEQSELRWGKVPDWLIRFSSAWGYVIPISKLQGVLQEEACVIGNYSNGAAMRFPMEIKWPTLNLKTQHQGEFNLPLLG